jgi:hypothetical protein
MELPQPAIQPCTHLSVWPGLLSAKLERAEEPVNMLPSVQYSTLGRLEHITMHNHFQNSIARAYCVRLLIPPGFVLLNSVMVLRTLGIGGYGAHAFLVLYNIP